MTRISSRVTNLETSLTEKADGDTAQMAVGMLLLWPTLFFLEGGDGPEAQEYSRLKGEFEALQQMDTVKKCSLPQSTQVAQAFATPTPAQVAAATALVSPTVPNPVVIPVATTSLATAPAASPAISQGIIAPQAAYYHQPLLSLLLYPALLPPLGLLRPDPVQR